MSFSVRKLKHIVFVRFCTNLILTKNHVLKKTKSINLPQNTEHKKQLQFCTYCQHHFTVYLFIFVHILLRIHADTF